MFEAIVFIIVGMFLLIKGADFLVDGASNVAKKFHIPEIIIGLTIVSIGTSMPELFVSLTSALEGYSDMAVGNIVGSNISNLLLILGMSAIIRNIRFRRETIYIEIPLCLTITALFWFLANTNAGISRGEGIFLLVLCTMFIIYTIIMARKGNKFNKENDENASKEKDLPKKSVLKDIIYVIGGIVALKFGGDLVVDNAVLIAELFNWSEKLISVTILAIGTSLPELVTSVSAAIKGKSDIALGNVLGSNIFNILLIIGVSAVIKPITYNLSYNTDMIFLIIATSMLALFPIIPPKCRVSRSNGVAYILMYVGYLATTILK